MKKAISRLSIIALVITALAACKNNTNEPQPNNTFAINIENGADYASKIDEVEFYIDRSENDFLLCRVPFNNGKLSLTFSEHISDAYLNLISEGDELPPTITISDPTAMIGIVSYRFYKNGKEVDNLSLLHLEEGQSSINFEYINPNFIYCNKPTVMSGSFTDERDNGAVMDLQLKTGYNQIYTEFEQVGTKLKITLSTSTNKVFKWNIYENN